MFKYPNPRRDESVNEDHFGTTIIDPYRWMEDPDSEETKQFVEQENEVSLPYIRSYEHREKINQRLTDLWNYPKYGVPHKEGSRYFFSKNSGLQNQSVMFMQDSLNSEPTVFFDPNSLSEDGTVSLNASSFSKDGSIWAYGLSKSGSDWFSVHFKNVITGENYLEVLEKVKFCSLTWTHDNKGIFYGCYPDHKADASGRNTDQQNKQKLYYHRVGTPQSDDVLVVEFPEHPKWRIHVEVSDCGRYLIVCPQEDCRDNLVYFSDLSKLDSEKGIHEKLELTQVVFEFKHDYGYITNTGSLFVFRTNCNAPNYQLVTVDFEKDKPEDNDTRKNPWAMKPLLKEHEKNVLEWSTCVDGDKLIVCYMKDVKNVLDVHDLHSGKFLYNLKLDIGSVIGFSGEKHQSEIFYKFSSMITPGITFHVDMSEANPRPKIFKESEIKGFNKENFQVEQVFYESKDGTKVPMFIASRKDAKRDGTSPCLLYGYGGFNISLTPYFSVTQLFFIQHFGYLAIPNIRGGGEYGENWHNGGRLLNKQNCFDDFQSAAEYLIANEYTSKEKIAIKGGSNGGLLVGACINQRPDLFGAGIASVGVMDMLRFHKFTIGYAWCSDFGNPDEEMHFKNILKFSPLHNIKPADGGIEYPAVLLTTADHDDRVVPSHSLKFIAELQHRLGNMSNQKNPLMIRVETKAGHGHGKPTSKVIEEVTEMFSFLAKTLKYEFLD